MNVRRVVEATPAHRAVGVALLLLVEGLLLAVRFDTGALASLVGDGWASPLRHVSEVPRLAIACGTVLVLGGRDLPALLRTAPDERPSDPRPFLALHLAALLAFVGTSGIVLEGPDAGATAWVAPWLATGLVTAASLAPIVARPAAWRRLLLGARGLVAASVAVGVVAWGAGRLTQLLAPSLQGLTSQAVFRFVAALRPDAYLVEGSFVVGTPRFHVEIAPACSGYEGMGLIAVFVALFLHGHRRSLRFPQALLLVPIAVGAAAVANVVRLGTLVVLGEFAPETARGGFHSYAGAALFSGIALAIAFVALRAPFFAVAPTQGAVRTVGGAGPTSADRLLAPFVAGLAVQLLTGLVGHGDVDRLQPLRIAVCAVALWAVRARAPAAAERSLAGPALGVGVGLVVAAAWLVLAPADPERTAALVRAAADEPTWAVASWTAARVVGSVVVAPLVEELAFRGYLARRLVAADVDAVDLRRLGPVAIGVSSLVFALFHAQVLAGFVAGVAYALVARRTGRLRDAVVAHATTNGMLVVHAVTTGAWSAWL